MTYRYIMVSGDTSKERHRDLPIRTHNSLKNKASFGTEEIFMFPVELKSFSFEIHVFQTRPNKPRNSIFFLLLH
jgi:hypothetical protein